MTVLIGVAPRGCRDLRASRATRRRRRARTRDHRPRPAPPPRRPQSRHPPRRRAPRRSRRPRARHPARRHPRRFRPPLPPARRRVGRRRPPRRRRSPPGRRRRSRRPRRRPAPGPPRRPECRRPPPARRPRPRRSPPPSRRPWRSRPRPRRSPPPSRRPRPARRITPVAWSCGSAAAVRLGQSNSCPSVEYSSVGWSVTAGGSGAATGSGNGVLARDRAARGLGQRQAAVRAVVGVAAEQLAAVRALAADPGLADHDVAADVVEAQLELVQLCVEPGQPRELDLAQTAVRLVLDVARRAVQLVDEAAEVAHQHLAGSAQEADAPAQPAAPGARGRGGGELVRVDPGGQIGHRDQRGLVGRLRMRRRLEPHDGVHGRGRVRRGRGGGLRGGGRRLGRVFVAEHARLRGGSTSRDSWPPGSAGALAGASAAPGSDRGAFGTFGAPAGQASEQAAHTWAGRTAARAPRGRV